jgi:3-hydroxyacyl-[acyl-carrier-protein] dehydratase
MPPEPFVDISTIDPSKVLVDHQGVYRVNPHRYEFELLDGILMVDREKGLIVGYRDAKSDEFWVKAHIPGRPIFPGVLMIETAAQLVSYYVMSENPGGSFLGFGGVDGVKFRGAVVPGDKVIMVGKMMEYRRRRCIGATQAFVNGQLVYEGTITGMWI